MTTLLLDSHVVHWWAAEPARLSRTATAAIEAADELAVSSVSWFELASLPSSFPGDPADRIVFATAVEHGWPLVTKDRRLREHRHPRRIAVW